MPDPAEHPITAEVIARLASTPDPRMHALMVSLTRHLHAFARETKLTEAEWFEAIRFLTAVGQKCDDVRQEFILLSDVLGLSMVVTDQNNYVFADLPKRNPGFDVAECLACASGLNLFGLDNQGLPITWGKLVKLARFELPACFCRIRQRERLNLVLLSADKVG